MTVLITMTRILDVTPEDIEHGRPGHICLCPFANAGRRLFGIENPGGLEVCLLGRRDAQMRVYHPRNCQTWTVIGAADVIRTYDDYLTMTPGRYKIIREIR